jgi:hypothetical protein
MFEKEKKNQTVSNRYLQKHLNLICILTFFHLFMPLQHQGDRLLDIPCKVCGDRSSGK